MGQTGNRIGGQLRRNLRQEPWRQDADWPGPRPERPVDEGRSNVPAAVPLKTFQGAGLAPRLSFSRAHRPATRVRALTGSAANLQGDPSWQ
ncbi:hypothetical protein MPL1032_220119 [Mesorhizobium plurifarium]|uniref:Uncharacterized protein n=1 Tax=Mesorhizobium plurifarium TaxID=69974 RepID=A0A0K2VZ05_MESPL|nr:hypothetical protein MPL1032_220119 [Mesorhizobium plurifarium]